MKKSYYFLSILLFSAGLMAQNGRFYATTDTASAKELEKTFPSEIEIIDINDNHAAVYISDKAAEYLHHNVITHGPGYVYKTSKDHALQSIYIQRRSGKILEFNIDQEILVNDAISRVDADNIKTHIQTLENYGTRRHTTNQAKTAVQDLKTKWEGMISAAGRSDVLVRLVNHVGTAMPSVVVTMNGASNPDEYVIIGGHLDTITINNSSQAPGADDDASGIATITEIFRVLLEMNYKPARTVEFMAFAAEEIGLVGSSEIAASYAMQNKNVTAFVQFDMTNYKGSSKDIYLTTDYYNSNDLNLFLMELMEHYNKTGAHAFTYGTTVCNYGCSDHFSFADNGYEVAFPFESSFSQYNPYIHTSNDKLSMIGNNANHAAKFAKLGLEFIIETAKSSTMAVVDTQKPHVEIGVSKGILTYKLGNEKIEHIQIYDVAGRVLKDVHQVLPVGSINLNTLSKGYYLAVFKRKDGNVVTKKFLIE